MNSLAHVLTQKIANDFMTNYEAVAFGSVNHIILRQLLGSHYRMKGRIQYQIIADRSAGVARLCEMPREFTNFDGEGEYRTIAHSQSLTFSTDEIDVDDWLNTPAASRPAAISLVFTCVDSAATPKYRIGAPTHIRLTRSYAPRLPITEIWHEAVGNTIDSEEEEETIYYSDDSIRKDDGQQGRPELAHFEFLPSSVRHFEVSKAILLSSQVPMSILNRVESLTLGTLWPWQLTPSAASSYWPSQLKRLKWKRWFHFAAKDESEDEDEEQEEIDDGNEDMIDVSGSRFFETIDISKITFPSTLTELEFPQKMYKLFNEEETNQLSMIQYPIGLTKLIRPFIPHQLAGWRLPKSLTHLECDFDPSVNGRDVSLWQLPSSLFTLTFTDVSDDERRTTCTNQDLSSLRLPASLTSLTLPSDYAPSLPELTFPSTLTHFNFPRRSHFPLDWSHTALRSFTVCPPPYHPRLSSFTLPSTVTRITFVASDPLPHVDSEYEWPSQLKEIELETTFYLTSPSFHLPSHLTRLLIRTTTLSGSPGQLKLPEGLQSLTIISHGCEIGTLWHRLILPHTLTEFVFDGESQSELPRLDKTQLRTLKLMNRWNRPITNDEFALPETLKSLHFSREFNRELDELRLPASLTELRFGPRFSQSLAPLASQMPTQLCMFALGTSSCSSEETHFDFCGSDFTHLSSLMDLHLPSTLQEIVLPSPSSEGIVLSPFHTRYLDFVTRLQTRGVRVKLIKSRKSKEKFV